MANGNLSQSQDLFSTKGGILPLSMILYYNSLDPCNGSLGRGWSHSYDISLVQNSNGSVLLKKGNWKRRLYTRTNGSYVSQPWDSSTLVKKTDNTFVITQKDGTKYKFDANGKITSIVDRNGNADTFSFTGDKLTTITDPGGRTVTFAYDANSLLTSVTDPIGNAYSFTYTGGTLATITNPDGGTWQYNYDANTLMLSKSDPLGNTTGYNYDANQRIVTSIDPVGMGRGVAYPQPGADVAKSTTFIDKGGGVWTYHYDTQAGTLSRKTDPLGNTTSYTYDANRYMLSKTEPVVGIDLLYL